MKKLLFLFAVVLTTLQLSAADVTPSQAQAAANTFLKKQVATGRLKASAASDLRLAWSEKSVARPSATDYYIFNSAKSYVVVAGDDLAPQILMYGEEGALDMDNIPPAMQWLLNKYKYQIDGLKAGPMEPVKAPKFATTAVAPLVTATWDQSAPYNNQCPGSSWSRALTGCPATSLSMCYYKWKWPETFPACAAISGTGGSSASALSERAADWANIIDHYGTYYDDNGSSHSASYTTDQANAVAWLMRYAGQSIPDYYYSSSASGANDPEIYQGVLNMGYTDAQYLLLTEFNGSSNGSQKYTDAQWNEWMLNELHNGRPIEYLAYDSRNSDHGGHAFNVFGVDSSGKYYVNWGWSGSSNGYCTLHNFTTANGSTSGSTGSYIFNWGEAMIIGIEPPAGALNNPRITVNPTTLTMNATVGTPETATFTVTGANLTSNVALSISGDNAFSLSTTSISASQAENGVTVTVTYNPTKAGNQEATVTLTSTDAETVTVKINGTAVAPPLETYAPVMQEASDITTTSFTATWTDATPAENVESYTLYVSAEPFTPAIALLDTTDWTASNSLPSGWSSNGFSYYPTNSASYLSSSGYVQTRNYDLNGYDKVSVMIYAEPYNSSNTITVATSAESKTITLPSGSAFAWYTVVLNCATTDYVRVTASGMPDMRYMKVYAGDLTTAKQLKTSESGDATYRVITGITSKSYTVTGLTEGGSFYFYVVANYTNGAVGNSNTEEVTLLDSDLERYTPVMQPANESYINLTSFRADWTDATPVENVASYTLEVNTKPEEPELPAYVEVGNADFSSLTAVTNTSGSYTNQISNASTYLPTGWSATTYLYIDDGAVVSRAYNSNYATIVSPTYDFTGYDKVTVVVDVLRFNADDYTDAIVEIASSMGSQQITFSNTSEYATYTVVLDVAQSDNITLKTLQSCYALHNITIYAGDKTAALNLLMASETGGPDYRLIEGIDAGTFNYTVNDLTAGGTFLYRVKAIYADGTQSAWSNVEEVTLFENGHGYELGDVNHDTVIDVSDVTMLIGYILGNDNGCCVVCADVNGDVDIDVSDVTALIGIILSSGDAAKTAKPVNGVYHLLD